MSAKEILRIAFTDFPGPANPDAIVEFLAREYDVQIDEENPEFVFYSVFGYQYMRYEKAVRIFFTGENVHPDFNLCDYAFGFDWMSFADRYYRSPNFFLYREFRELRDRGRTDATTIAEVAERGRFCNFIYSNGNAHPYREELFHALCEYRKVDSAGKHLNNTGFMRGSPSLGYDATQDKIEFQRECKFTIAMENSSSVGYTTEKLIHALAADTIPIYWGDPEVGREFNSKRFVNCHEYDSVSAVVERVKEIDSNNELFRAILAEPFFSQGNVPTGLLDENLMAQFHNIFDRPAEMRKRRNEHVWGKIYEQKRRDETRPLTSKDALRAVINGIKRRLSSSRKGSGK